VDEERENRGMKAFIESDISADYALVGEPTELDVCIGHKGVSRIRLTAIGKSSHAASIGPHNNAIYSMSRMVTALEQCGFTWKADPYLFLSACFIDANHNLPHQLSSAIHRLEVNAVQSEHSKQRVKHHSSPLNKNTTA